jgi:hypothetical protein
MTVGSRFGRSSCVGAQRSALVGSAAHAPENSPPIPVAPMPPALQGGPAGAPGLEGELEPPRAVELLVLALGRARPVRSMLAARRWSRVAALGPLRLGEVQVRACEREPEP